MRRSVLLSGVGIGALLLAALVIVNVATPQHRVTVQTAAAVTPDVIVKPRIVVTTTSTTTTVPPTTTTRPPVTTTTMPPTPATTSPPVIVHASSGGWVWPWSCIAEGVAGGAAYGNGESGGDPTLNTGNGYWGGLQFVPSTWWSFARPLGIDVPAYEASIQQQEAVADRVLASGGWGQWPSTSRACGLR